MNAYQNRNFHAFIRAIRCEKKIRIKDVAHQMGVSSLLVLCWERGLLIPPYNALNRLCEAIGTTFTNVGFTPREAYENSVIAVVDSKDAAQKAAFSCKRMRICQRLRVFAILICMTILFCTIGGFAQVSYHASQYPRPLLLKITSGYEKEGDTSQWNDLFPAHSAYALGLNKANKPVFKNPNAAFHQIKIECSDAIAALQETFDLAPFSTLSVLSYITYSWQLPNGGENKNIIAQCNLLSSFGGIYENSFC